MLTHWTFSYKFNQISEAAALIACLQLPKAEIQADRRQRNTFPLTRSAL